jgi:hypothetical protein
MTQAYPIPRSLWESLDAILFTKGIALAKEIAAELNVSAKDIISSLTAQDLGKFTFIPDEEGTVYQCEALTQHGAVYMRCRYPVLGSAPRVCSEHHGYSMEVPKLPIMNRLVTPEAIYMYNKDTSEVFSLNGILCGRMKGSKLLLFNIQD